MRVGGDLDDDCCEFSTSLSLICEFKTLYDLLVLLINGLTGNEGAHSSPDKLSLRFLLSLLSHCEMISHFSTQLFSLSETFCCSCETCDSLLLLEVLFNSSSMGSFASFGSLPSPPSSPIGLN